MLRDELVALLLLNKSDIGDKLITMILIKIEKYVKGATAMHMKNSGLLDFQLY